MKNFGKRGGRKGRKGKERGRKMKRFLGRLCWGKRRRGGLYRLIWADLFFVFFVRDMCVCVFCLLFCCFVYVLVLSVCA